MKLILDFDDTLFNNAKFKKHLFYIAQNYGITNVEELYTQSRSSETPFSLKNFLQKSLPESNIDNTSSVEQMYEEIMSICETCVNKDVIDLVKNVGKNNCFLVTHGDDEFQKDKINMVMVRGYFSEVIIVPGSKKAIIESLCERYSSQVVIFVDDKIRFFEDIDMERCKNLKTVLFDNGGIKNLSKEIEESRRGEVQELGSQTSPFLGNFR